MPYVDECSRARRPVVAPPTTCARSPTRSGRGCAGRYTRARHRRLRAQRLPQGAARFFEVDRHHVAVAALQRARRRRDRARALAEAIEQLRDRRPTRSAAMAEVKEVAVPDIGDFDDVPVIEILVSPGDAVAAEDPLVTLESDKATMDVPAPFAGTWQELKVAVGDKVSEGSLLLTLEVNGDGAAPSPASAAAPAEAAARRRGRDRDGRRGGGRHGSPRSEARAGAGPPSDGDAPRRTPARRCAGSRASTAIDLAASRAPAARAASPRRTSSAPARRSRRAPAPAAPAPAPSGRLREVRRGRARRAVAHPADLGPEPRAQLGDDPARHPPRRGRHHRPRGVPQASSTPSRRTSR